MSLRFLLASFKQCGSVPWISSVFRFRMSLVCRRDFLFIISCKLFFDADPGLGLKIFDIDMVDVKVMHVDLPEDQRFVNFYPGVSVHSTYLLTRNSRRQSCCTPVALKAT